MGELMDGMVRYLYRKYMQGDHWRKTRKHKLLAENHTCEICGANKGNTPPRKLILEVHHLSYKNLGYETLDELQVTCDRCHMELHGIDKN